LGGRWGSGRHGVKAQKGADAGVDVRFVNLPMIEGATGKLLQQMVAAAELEARPISARAKAALALPSAAA